MALTEEQKERLANLIANKNNIQEEVDRLRGIKYSTQETLATLGNLSDEQINEIWPGTVIIDSGSDGTSNGDRPT